MEVPADGKGRWCRNIYMHRTNTLYALHVHNVVCQFCLKPKIKYIQMELIHETMFGKNNHTYMLNLKP